MTHPNREGERADREAAMTEGERIGVLSKASGIPIKDVSFIWTLAVEWSRSHPDPRAEAIIEAARTILDALDTNVTTDPNSIMHHQLRRVLSEYDTALRDAGGDER